MNMSYDLEIYRTALHSDPCITSQHAEYLILFYGFKIGEISLLGVFGPYRHNPAFGL